MLTQSEPKTRVTLCARFEIEVDGRSLVGALRGGQARLVVAYLISNRGRAVSRDELVDVLWPERMPKEPHAQLRPILSGIRRALGRELLEGRDEVRLDLPESVWIDSEVARSAVEAARTEARASNWRAVGDRGREALALLSGGFLPSYEAEWIEARRREHDELEQEALEWIARSALALGGGELGSAQEAGRALIARAPYRESGYRLLMEALAASGNTAEALRVYETLRCLLRDELGTVPAPDVQALHEALLKGGVPLRPAPDTPALALPAPLARATARGNFVGRASELELLEAAWADATAGEATLVLLEGEPGSGKTRLAAEFARAVHAAGATVLYGRCSEEALGGYEPFVEALDAWTQGCSAEQLRAIVGARAGELAGLVPALANRLGDLPAPPRADPELARYRLLDAVRELLATLASASPLLLILDDLHWADRSTLLLYRHLSRTSAGVPVVVLGTYRRDVRSGAPLAALLGDLRREVGYRELSIGGLAEDETASLVETHVGQAPPPELARAIHEQADGNPFYIEALVRHLIDRGRLQPHGGRLEAASAIAEVGLPDDINDVIRRRLARLAGQTPRALVIASACGRQFDLDLLARVIDIEAEHLAEVLEDAVAARLIEEAPGAPGEFRFAHALIREALYEQMTAARRVRLHRRIGEELERIHAADDASRLPLLAYHFCQASEAGDAAKAVHYARRAAEQATAQLAYDEAAGHYERALAVLPAAGHAEDLRLELLIDLGDAFASAGAAQQGRSTFKAAAELARELKAPQALGRAALGFGRNRFLHLLQAAVDHELIELLEDALGRLPAQQQPLRARLLARLSLELHYTYDAERIAALLGDAIEIARASGDTATLGHVMSIKPVLMVFAGHGLEDPDGRLAVATEALDLSERSGDREDELYARCMRVMALIQLGDFDGVDAETAAVERLAAETRVRQYLWFARTWSAMRALMTGRFGDGDRLAHEALAVGAETIGEGAGLHFGYQQSLMRVLTGDYEGVEPMLLAAAEHMPELAAIPAALAWLYAQLDRIDDAEAAIERLLADGARPIPRDATWLLIGFFLAGVCERLEDAERAPALYRELLPYDGGWVSEGGPGSLCYGSLSLPLGQLAAAMSHWDDAARHFEAALRDNARAGARPWVAWTAVDYARTLLRRGDARNRDRALELLAEALETSRELGMKALESRARALRETPAS